MSPTAFLFLALVCLGHLQSSQYALAYCNAFIDGIIPIYCRKISWFISIIYSNYESYLINYIHKYIIIIN